jgi:ribonucleoside-diphosphate reductase beta chain
MSNLLKPRETYKPFEYPWMYDAYKKQRALDWHPSSVSLHNDVRDWNNRLTDAERNLLTQLFRFFTQGDISVAEGYLHKYIPIFAVKPEASMMLSCFANAEANHIDSYSLLLETIGIPETEYKAFQEYEEMAAKKEYLENTLDGHEFVSFPSQTEDLRRVAKALAIYSAFTEGLQLFSTFAILLNFPRFGKMKGMGQIVTWSQKDELLHVESMIKLFRTLIVENIELWTDDFKAELYQACRDMVELEDRFIDLAFGQGGIEGLTSAEVKQYIRYLADQRLLQLGLKTNYGVKNNPLPWIEDVLGSVEHANFFEATATEYAKGATTGSWSDVF